MLPRNEEMAGRPSAPGVQLPLLPSRPGGVHGLRSEGPDHHFISRQQSYRGRRCWDGGESGIRTHGRLPYTRFPVVHLRPLGHLSKTPNIQEDPKKQGRRGWDSNPRWAEPTVDFESTAFVHSATSPLVLQRSLIDAPERTASEVWPIPRPGLRTPPQSGG